MFLLMLSISIGILAAAWVRYHTDPDFWCSPSPEFALYMQRDWEAMGLKPLPPPPPERLFLELEIWTVCESRFFLICRSGYGVRCLNRPPY